MGNKSREFLKKVLVSFFKIISIINNFLPDQHIMLILRIRKGKYLP